ncbi:MAG TPA: energy transducer TonB [Terriglobales bacterium]|nr:energy transducer TonB [Terriglobales bacterium]
MRAPLIGLSALVVLTTASILAQQPANVSPSVLAYEDGAFADNRYGNECFGFSLAVPEGWHVDTQVIGADAKARHTPGGGLALVVVERGAGGAFGDRVVLTALETNGTTAPTQDFVSRVVRGQIGADPQHRELVRDVYTIDYAGKHFARGDYKQMIGDRPLYLSFAYTQFRGYYLGGTVMAGSSEELEQSASLLQQMSFGEDKRDARCVMRGDVAPGVTGVIGSVAKTSQSGAPDRVRVTQGVTTGLLIKKVNPVYPEDARVGHIQGQVVLQVEIDKEGNIETVSLVSGHPLLVPAATEAVKQWKYKPYLLDGKPVKVVTQVVVNFTLSN